MLSMLGIPHHRVHLQPVRRRLLSFHSALEQLLHLLGQPEQLLHLLYRELADLVQVHTQVRRYVHRNLFVYTHLLQSFHLGL